MGNLEIGVEQIFEHYVYASNIKRNSENKKQLPVEKVLLGAISIHAHKIEYKHHIIRQDNKKDVRAGLNLRYNSKEGLRLVDLAASYVEKHLKGQEIKT